MKTEITLFEDFLNYCKEDNIQLSKDIETWLADYFDVKNRCVPMTIEETDWIANNLSVESQIRIFGKKIDSIKCSCVDCEESREFLDSHKKLLEEQD